MLTFTWECMTTLARCMWKQARSTNNPGYATLHKFVLNAGAVTSLAMPRPGYRMEFIGDSVVSGWGSRRSSPATPLPGGLASCADPLFGAFSNSYSFG
jgi:hypothetical protein